MRYTNVTATYDKVIQVDYRNARIASEILVEFKTQVQEWKDVLLRGKDPQQLDKYWGAFQEHEKNVASASKRLQTTLPDGKAHDMVGQFAEAHAKMGADYRRGYAAFVAAGFDPSAGDAAVKGKDRAPAAVLKQLEESIFETTASAVLRAEEDEKRGIFISVAVMLASVVVSLVSGWRVSRTLILQLGGEPDYAAAVTHRIAGGDLGSPVDLRPQDRSSLLFSIKEMQSSLAKIVGDVRRGTESIATASGEIAAGNLDLSSRTEQQAGSLAETASSMEELTTTVKHSAENARQANNLALSASRVAVRGGVVVGQVVQTMGSINDSAKRIVDIISVIDGIAFQTNILALNAAVEAARAGEQGRGFAVVAAEVRTLAQRSAGAAKEIKTLIGDSVEKIQAGSKLVSDAGSTMDEIVDSVKHVTDIMAEMLVASEEQSAGIERINLAISRMDEVTQQNAALVEESSAAATTMSDQAGRLSQNVAVFRLGSQRADMLLLA